MTTIGTKLATGPVPSAGPALHHSAGPIEDRRVRWRLALDSAWQRKIDEVITLSKAVCGLTSEDDAGPADPVVQVSARLRARTERAYDELAAIEEAIVRIDDETYGLCAGCERAMSDEWLADKPEVRYCPDCSLRLVSWQRPGLRQAPRSAAVHRAGAEDWSPPRTAVKPAGRPVSLVSAG